MPKRKMTPVPPLIYSKDRIPRLMTLDDPVHWRCPDCFQPCRCDPIIRDLRHVRCGVRPETQLQ